VEESLRFGAQASRWKSAAVERAEIARSEWHLQGQLPLHICVRILIMDLRKRTRRSA